MNLPFKFPREAALLLMVVGVGLVFGATTSGFSDPINLADRSRYWVEIGLIAVPMTFVIAAGGIDLSVGSLLALASVVAGRLFQLGCSLPVVIAGTLLTGCAGGMFNAAAIQLLRLPPLIVTLATLALFRGLAYGICNATPISGWPESFTDWGSFGAWHPVVGWDVPWPFLILLGVVACGAVFFHRHRLGRQARQIGENPLAARFAGLSEPRIRWIIYGLSGLACGLSAVLWTARFATAHPAAGQGMELDVIAVVVLGGTRITGGSGSIIGSFLGLILLGFLRYGLDLRGVAQQDQTILVGLMVVAVAVLNGAWSRRVPAPAPARADPRGAFLS